MNHAAVRKDDNAFKMTANLTLEMSNLVQLEEILQGEYEITPEVVAAFLEGNTQTFEIVDMISNKLLEEEINEAGISEAISKLQARKSRAIERKNRLKDCVALVFEATKADKIERPAYTCFKRNNPPKLEIADEKKLPSEYVNVVMVTEINNKAIKEQLSSNKKNKEAVSELAALMADIVLLEDEYKDKDKTDKGYQVKAARFTAKKNKLEGILADNVYKDIEGAKLISEGYSITFKRD